jgi:hypothetical protein
VNGGEYQAIQNWILNGMIKVPLLTPSRENLKVAATFLRILAAPLQEALKLP